MKKIVLTLIMLPAILLSLTGGNTFVASTYAAKKTSEANLKPPSVSVVINPDISSVCFLQKKNYPLLPKKITSAPSQIVLASDIPVVPTTADSQPEVASIAVTAETLTPEASQTAIPLASVTTPTPAAGSSGGLNAEVIFAMVNQIRIDNGLVPFEKHPEVCAVVQSRAPELNNEIYGSSYIHAGFQARKLPFSATENMISQQTEQEAILWWMNSSVHRSALLGSTKYACVACEGKSCAMIFSNVDAAPSH